MYLCYKTTYLNEEVKCTEGLPPQLVFPGYGNKVEEENKAKFEG
jgi:hypothetical protein